jgi:hypothetical protein
MTNRPKKRLLNPNKGLKQVMGDYLDMLYTQKEQAEMQR